MKGIKQDITKASFSKSTLRGIIRKGFITKADLDKTSLTEHTKQVIRGLDIDLLFVRDKQVVFCLDNKNKVVYDCQSSLGKYLDYFQDKNNYEVIKVDNVHPADLRARGLSVDKIASENNFTL